MNLALSTSALFDYFNKKLPVAQLINASVNSLVTSEKKLD